VRDDDSQLSAENRPPHNHPDCFARLTESIDGPEIGIDAVVDGYSETLCTDDILDDNGKHLCG
jgi:hypothetical protein